MKQSGFTFPELIAVMVLLALLFAMRASGINGDNPVKLQSALLHAQLWANEADRARQSGTIVNGNVQQIFSNRQIAPFLSPFNTPYYVTMTNTNVQVSFRVPFPVGYAFADLTPLAGNQTLVSVSPELASPSTAAVEKLQLYQQAVIL